MKRVFISYSRRNKAFAELLARDLDDAGLQVWIDFRQIIGGELWQNEIYRGIERSEFVIFCMSPDSVKSEWCNKEIIAAREQDKLIIPIMVVNAYDDLQQSENLSWILNVHFIDFTKGYEQTFPELLNALPGSRPIGVYDVLDPDNIPNPFKGLEAFQQTDSHFFFGRERMIERSLARMQQTRFLAFVGASGSGKSSLVRAGILPAIRNGKIPHSETWRTAIFTPGTKPLESLATRIIPLLPVDETRTVERVVHNVQDPKMVSQFVELSLDGLPPESRLLIVIDQFEEVFTRASVAEAQPFIDVLVSSVKRQNNRLQIILTMRADFFGNLSAYPELAQLFEQENMIIVTEMTAANMRRAIEGPVQAVGLKYEDGLVDRILEDVRSQPGSLPLLQYALRQLFDKREGLVLTNKAYDEIGGVRRALAQHAEEIFSTLTSEQQEVTRRILLRLVEVGDTGEATRRKVAREELQFDDIDDAAVEEVIDLLTAADSRLLIASREIRATDREDATPTTWLEVSHEALIREWDRFKTWVSSRLEDLQYNTELRKLSQDWQASGRDAAYLLVGKRLTRAEVWIDNADANALQREFIAESLGARADAEKSERERQERELQVQQESNRRLRILTLFLVLGFAASVVAAVITITQRNELETLTGALSNRTDELEAQSQVLERTVAESQSLALSAEAENAFADRDNDLAIALALESVKIENPPIRTQSTLNDIALAAGTRRLINTTGLTIQSIAYSPDATRLATGLNTGEIIIWEVATGNELVRWQAHNEVVTSLDYRPDGTQIVSGSGGTSENLKVWDAESGEWVTTLEHHTNRVTTVVYSPDGRFFISGSIDRTYVAWWSDTFAQGYLGERPTDIQEIDTAGDDEGWIVAIADTNRITILNSTWQSLIEIVPTDSELGGTITSLKLSQDSNSVMAGFSDGGIGIWDTTEGFLTQSFPALESRVNAVDFLPRDQKVVAGLEDGTLRIWDVITRRQTDVFTLESAVKDIAVNFREVRLAASLEGSMRIWDIQGSAEIQRFSGHRGQVSAIAYHPDGERMLSGSFDSTLLLWEIESGTIVQNYVGHEGGVVAVAFNPDGSRFVSGSNDQTARIWDTESGEITLTLEGHDANITSVAWHPSSAIVATGALDSRIIIWDADTGEQLLVLEGHTSSVASVEFNADGTRLLSASFDNSLIMWDTSSGEQIQQFNGHTGSVFAGSFSLDGRQIVSGSVDRTVRVWDVASGREIRRMEGHDRVVNSVEFVANSSAIVSASSDGTLRLWDTATGAEIYRYTVTNNFGRVVPMRVVDVNKAGEKAITGMGDATVRLWQILPTVSSLGDFVLNNRFVRTLNCNEEITFGLRSTIQNQQQVFINVDEPLVELLFDPTDGAVTGEALNGESVNLLRTDTFNGGEVFFEVCTASGERGWTQASNLDGLS